MTDEAKKELGEESFEQMMKDFDAETGEGLRVGDKVRGKIVSIGEMSVFVDVGAKVEGMVDPAELKDENGELPLSEGDEIELYVVSMAPGSVTLSKALSGDGGMEALRQAFEAKVPVQGKVTGTNKGGFEVRAMGKRAFCPMSQMELSFVQDPTVYVGQSFEFVIIKFEKNGRNIVLSRRDLLEREKAEAQQKFLQEVQEGQVLEGTVKNLAPYGAFVEIAPGLAGLVHISELSWARVGDPSQAVQPGEQVRVKVLGVEEGKKDGQLKISLSIKQAGDDPWASVGERFEAGQKVTGKVVRLADFGAFVEIAPGVEGLVHVSEMSYAKRVNRPEEVVAVGQDVSVMIKDIDVDRRRLGLSIKDAEGDPWLDVPQKYPAGGEVEGEVEKLEQFGIFIQLEPGVTGLLPKSKIARAQDPKVFDALKPGDAVRLRVEEIDTGRRKITLGPVDSRQAEDWKKFAAPKKENKVAGGMGLLGEKLQEALNKKG